MRRPVWAHSWHRGGAVWHRAVRKRVRVQGRGGCGGGQLPGRAAAGGAGRPALLGRRARALRLLQEARLPAG